MGGNLIHNNEVSITRNVAKFKLVGMDVWAVKPFDYWTLFIIIIIIIINVDV